jgi:acyl dehydratase
MAIDYDYLMGLPPLEIDHEFTARDTILYALGVGVGTTNEADNLRFIYEKNLVGLPTMAVVLAYPGFWAKDPKYGITWQKLLHAEQSVEWHRDLPIEGRVSGLMTIDEIYDQGKEKGAWLHFSRRIFNHATGDLIATVRQVNVLRADGGFGGRPKPIATPHSVPARAPDQIIQIPTSRAMALIYRLSGDLNPLHVDPAVAVAAGFERPILHGLATYGAVGRILLSYLCDNDPTRMKRFDTRFSGIFYPGETLEISIWQEGPGKAYVEANALERRATVLRNGYVEFTPQ